MGGTGFSYAFARAVPAAMVLHIQPRRDSAAEIGLRRLRVIGIRRYRSHWRATRPRQSAISWRAVSIRVVIGNRSRVVTFGPCPCAELLQVEMKEGWKKRPKASATSGI